MARGSGIGSALAARSFSLYVVHAPVVTLLLACAQREGWWLQRGNFDAVSSGVVAGLCLLCMAVAAAFAAVTEQRTPQLREWLLRRHRRAAVAGLT